MARLRIRSEENDKLAVYWSRDDVALITMNWRSEREFGLRLTPSLVVEVMRKSVSPQGESSMFEQRYTFNFLPEGRQPWVCGTAPQPIFFEIPKAEVKAKLETIIAELSSRYSKLCVCSLRPRYVLNGLAILGFRLPKGTVMVDLISVVEFQAAPDTIDETMASWTGEVVERKTRYGTYTGASHLTGGAYASRVLANVGPKAHCFTKDLRRMEKESRAAERLREPLGAREVMKIRRERPRA
ncbi:hypothetical protein F5X68DRAFT_188116 [Plectosphaerella plurivora]|uniref:Uncharacterized protein n=1 Tax=Plectosphaerella plurivora TaxID=936078 RepID=A0A9P8VJN2_9PEZI|nr:hypothetical protein F5X68DRAFT_188116 [Plectosphaerella plurivora]